MVTVTSIILIVLSNIPALVNSHLGDHNTGHPYKICQQCQANDDCNSHSCVEPGICSFGPIGGDEAKPPPLCSSDLFCLYWDANFIGGDAQESETAAVIGASCLRCCPIGENGENYCTSTVSPGQENCGVIVEHFQAFGSVAPCCADDVCLDNVAGICGETVDESCGECMRWSYVIGDETFDNVVGDALGGIIFDRPLFEKVDGLQYRIFDDCGEGLTCLPDTSKQQVSKSDH
eukprot:819706_1